MKNLITKKIFLVYVIFSTTIFGQSLGDYLRSAVDNNPGLKSKFYSYMAALEKVNQAGSLPDPELTLGVFTEPMQRFMGNQVADFSLMQMFPWFGVLSAAEDEALLMAKSKYELFNDYRTMLLYEVKVSYYSLYFIEKEITLNQKNLEILKTLSEVAVSRVKSGESGMIINSSDSGMKGQSGRDENADVMDGMEMQNKNSSESGLNSRQNGGMQSMSGGSNFKDVLSVQIEINDLVSKLDLLRDTKRSLQVQFNKLLNRSSDELVNIPDTLYISSLPIRLAELPDSIKSNNPMLLMLQKEEESLLAKENMNKKMGFPMIGIGLQYSIFQQRPGNMMEARNMIMPMATIRIPIWRDKYDGAVEESRLLRESILRESSETENKLLISYEETLTKLNDAERRIKLYQEQSELAEQLLKLIITEYTSAGTEFNEVLRMQQRVLDYKLSSLRAVVDQNITIAMIERLIGR